MRLYTVPRMADLVEQVRPGLALDAGDRFADLKAPERRPISINPEHTEEKLLLLLSLAALFFLTVWWADRRDRIRWMLVFLTFVGFLVSGLGLLQFLTWNGKLLWFRRVASRMPFGPFVNHNHFAGYVEMIIPIAVSLGLYLLESRRATAADGAAGSASAPMFAAGEVKASQYHSHGQAALAMFAAVILVVSLMFSLSRGGILSTMVSVTVLFGILWRRIRSRRLAWSLAVGLPVIVMILIAWIGVGVIAEHFTTSEGMSNDASFRARALIWVAIVRHVPEFLWTGSGAGTFEESFAPFTPLGTAARWDKAHNDYLQFAWEDGLVGLVLFGFAAQRFIRRYAWPALTRRRDQLDLFRVGLVISLMSIALHSLVDFNLQIGANGFLFVYLAALLVALQRLDSKELHESA
jgi:O-antigen ligase